MYEVIKNIAETHARVSHNGGRPKQYPLDTLAIGDGFHVEVSDVKKRVSLQASVIGSFRRASLAGRKFRTYRTETGFAVERIA